MTFPSNPNNNDIHTAFGRRLKYRSATSTWEVVSSPSVAIETEAPVANTAVSSSSDLPLTGNEIGAMSYSQDTNTLYVWNGSGWFKIALVNTNPTITDGGQATYQLANDGTPTIVTLDANDPEGIPITWSYVVSSGSLEDTTVTNEGAVFTITPGEIDATFDLTFTASDGVNIDTSVSSFTLLFVSALWKDTSLSIGTSSTNGLTNTTFVDRSTNDYAATAVGNVNQTSFHPYLDNWSVEFGGTPASDYINVVDNSMVSLGEFTIELWFYSNLYHKGTLFHWSDFDPGLDNDLSINSDGSIECRIGTSGNTKTTSSSGLWKVGTWHHIAVVRNSSNNIDVYLDGAHIIDHGVKTDDMDNTLIIGRNPFNGGVDGYKGYISNFRIVESALYTSNFTIPTIPLSLVSNTKLLTFKSNRYIDLSNNQYTLDVFGNIKISAFNPFGQISGYALGENKGSAYLDGSGDYLTVSNNTNLQPGSDDFTLECWVYVDDDDGSQSSSTLAGMWNISGGRSWRLNVTGTGYTLTANSTTTVFSGSYNFLNNWAHIAWVKNGSTNRFYINGVSVALGSLGTYDNSTEALAIGFNLDNAPASWYFDGYISDFRIIKGTSLYSSNFTPPTAPVGNTNASLYLPMDNAGVYDKTAKTTLALFGNTSTSTTQTKFADTAMYFDGTGDYLTVNSTATLSTGNFTIEAWVYRTSTSTDENIFVQGSSGSGGFGIAVYINKVRIRFGSSNLFTSSDTLTQNTWYHIALVRNGTTLTGYLNGVSFGTSANASNQTATQWNIGHYGTGNYLFTGYIENLQVIKGVAKYTANFTPPTQEQGRGYQAES